MLITLHATVKGHLWGGALATLEIVKPLRRDKPLKAELSRILHDCGDFQGGSKTFTDASYIEITRSKPSKRGVTIVTRIPLQHLPSLAYLLE